MKIKGNGKYLAVLAIQIIVIGILVGNLFREKTDIQVDASYMESCGMYTEDGWYIDETYGTREAFVTSQQISVPAGVYKVQLMYQTDTDMRNMCTISDPFAVFGEVLSNGETLYSGLNTTDYDVWVFDGNGSLLVQVDYGGVGQLTVQGLRMYDTGALQRMLLFGTFVLFCLVDGLYVFYQSKKRQGISTEKKVIVLSLLAIMIYSSLPLMTDYIITGGDLIFHLLRIEGVKDGMLSGQFPVRIAPEAPTILPVPTCAAIAVAKAWKEVMPLSCLPPFNDRLPKTFFMPSPKQRTCTKRVLIEYHRPTAISIITKI